ncbi:MAG: hydroxymethylbilane synthase [Deltaproteobacteria bacterium]|nr:hydroxymethylbilane synthase [Deltaproteobacteria bacterium]
MSAPIRIATRGSALALAQARMVGAAAESVTGRPFELLVLTTTGDRIQDRALAAIGGKGLFVKEIQEALLDGRADLAVHSAKDLPSKTPDSLTFAAFPRRADPRDALVARDSALRVATLPRGARIGTGSVRRTSQLRARRPDLEIVPIRGNVDTRLRKLDELALHGVILACAGLERLGLGERIHERIEPADVLPAVGQGTLALEVRADDALVGDLADLDHPQTRACLHAERAFQAGLEGDCAVPIAAFAELDSVGRLRLRGLVAKPDGSRVVRGEIEASASDAIRAGDQLARELRARGGEEILAALRGSSQ